MAPLAVDPDALDGAGAAVVSVGEGLGSVVSTLTTALAGCNGMAGDDPAGAAFGRSYNSSAPKLLQAMAATRNGLCRLGDGVRMSAHNYSVAEAMSNVSGHGNPLPVPPSTGPVSAGSTPSAVGSGVGAPAGWGWVAPFIGMIWPDGDSAKLRAAAGAWTSAGTNFEVSEILGAVGPMGSIGAQQIPEGPAIAAAFTDANRSAAGILQQCGSIAAQLNAYAAKIDHVHAAILDLLSRICDPMTGLKEVWDILTDKDEDEIKKIANDIRTIVNDFTAEVDALRQQITTVLSEATTILTTMGRYAEKEWDQFLHGTDVGRAVNQVGQYAKGFGEEIGGLLEDDWTYGPLRAMVDPNGWYHSWGEMVSGMAPLVGLGGDGAPGVAEAWKGVGKAVTHWDEWSKNPAEAAGKSTFDIATLFLPGGPLSKGSKLSSAARDALDAARGLRKPPVPEPPRPPHVEAPRATPPARGEPAPSTEPPNGGRPAPAPQPKPTPAPHGPVPHVPTESKVPVAPRPSPSEGPKPLVEPAPSAPGHSPAAEAPKLPAAPPSGPSHAPLNGEPSPAVSPSATAPNSPGGYSAEPPPAAAHAPQAGPVAPPARALHLPGAGHPPDALPPRDPRPGSGYPAEPPQHGGAPRGRLPEALPPHDGAPHRPGDEGTPHATEDGSDHGPHPGGSFVGPYQLPAPELVTPPPDGAFFWSGRTSEGIGIGPQSAGGNGAADLFAASHGGTTLEGLLERNGVKPPKFSFDDRTTQEWWSKVSGMYAENVRGEVYAVIGPNSRPGSVWKTVELPRLIDNPNVTKIVIIDPETGSQRTILER